MSEEVSLENFPKKPRLLKDISAAILNRGFHYHPPECHLHALMLFGYVMYIYIYILLYIIYKGMIGYL